VERVVVDRGELTIHVRAAQLRELLQVLRDDARLRFELCLGVSGVHWPQQTGAELHAVYHFASITHGMRRVRFEATCSDDDAATCAGLASDSDCSDATRRVEETA